MITTGRMFVEELPPKLSTHEEKELLELLAKGDKDAREKLIVHNMRLISHLIYTKFKNLDCADDELFSVGLVGLIKGVDTYNTDKGSKIATYLLTCISNEICLFIKNIREIKH